MTARSTCLSPFCAQRVPERTVRCPACGRPMFDDAEIARRGRHVGQLGLILAGVMGGVLWFWAPGMMRAMAGTPRTSFTGTAEQAWWMLAGLGAIGLTGVAFALSGGLMILGRASRVATMVAIGLFLTGLGCLAVVLVSAYGR